MEAEAAVVAATTVVDDVDDDDDDCDSSIDVVVVAAVARGCEADTRSEVPLMAPGTAQCTETEAATEAEAAHSIVSAVLSER